MASGCWSPTRPPTTAPVSSCADRRIPRTSAAWRSSSGSTSAAGPMPTPGTPRCRTRSSARATPTSGVSAQLIGVEGGPVLVEVDVPGAELAGLGMKAIDPERYGALDHPGDAFSYDIYTQVARALREGQGFGDLEPSMLVASGQSQSAAAMVSYINGVQPLTQAFDAFFVHSRGGSGMPFPPVGESVDFASTIGGTPSILRTDTDVPDPRRAGRERPLRRPRLRPRPPTRQRHLPAVGGGRHGPRRSHPRRRRHRGPHRLRGADQRRAHARRRPRPPCGTWSPGWWRASRLPRRHGSR